MLAAYMYPIQIYIGIGYILPTICQLESFPAPFERRVWECTYFDVYICIEYKLPTFGEYVSVKFMHWRVSVSPSDAGLGNVHFVIYTY